MTESEMRSDLTPEQRLDEVERRLARGDARMNDLAARLVENTAATAENTAATERVEQNTKDLVELFQSAQGAFKVLTWIGKVAKPIWYIAAAVGALVGAAAAIKNGGGTSEMKARIAIAALSLSAAGFVGILAREGYEGKSYPDPVHGTKVPTIGFGSTEGVKMGDTITPVKAVQRSLREVGVHEAGVKACVKVELSQGEYDAFVGLAHNAGVRNFCQNKDGGPSIIVRRLQARDYEGACDAILLYRYSGGVDCSAPGNRVCGGLWADRQRLHAICKSGG